MAQQGSGYQARYKRILLKLSGEALMGSEEFGIDPKVLDRMALEVGQLVGELDRIARSAEFNGQKLLDGSFGTRQFQVGANAHQTIAATTAKARP